MNRDNRDDWIRTWSGHRVRVKQGWLKEGKEGIAIGEPIFVGQEWLPVLWDDEEDPTFHKLAALSKLYIAHELDLTITGLTDEQREAVTMIVEQLGGKVENE